MGDIGPASNVLAGGGSAPSLLLISASFRMRRKKLLNNLNGWKGLTRDAVMTALNASRIHPDARAETLALGEFDRLRGDPRSRRNRSQARELRRRYRERRQGSALED